MLLSFFVFSFLLLKFASPLYVMLSFTITTHIPNSPLLFHSHESHIPTQQLVNKKLTLVFLCVAGRGEGSRLEEIKTFKFLCSSKGTRTSIWNVRQRCESIHKKNEICSETPHLFAKLLSFWLLYWWIRREEFPLH